MQRAMPVMSVVMAVISPFALVMILGLIVLGRTSGPAAVPDSRAAATAAPRPDYIETHGETLGVKIGIAEDAVTSKLKLYDAEGEDLASCTRFRSGTFTIESPESEALRFILSRNQSRSVGFGLHYGTSYSYLEASSDGSSVYRVVGPEGIERCRLEIRPPDEVLFHKGPAEPGPNTLQLSTPDAPPHR